MEWRKVRKRIGSSLLAVLMLVVSLPTPSVKATGSMIGDFPYTLSRDRTAILGRYRGPGGDVVIPDSIDGYEVTEIGKGAFGEIESITSVVIPDSVVTVGDEAFIRCVNMKSIHFGEKVKTIGWDAVAECTALTEIVIPDGVQSLSTSGTFHDCTNVTKLTLGNGMIDMGGYSFQGLHNLTELVIPDDFAPRSIGPGLFFDCSNLDSVTIGKGIYKLPSRMFGNCGKLRNVTFLNPETTIHVGTGNPFASGGAFEGTNNIANIFGYRGSMAETFANDYGFQFSPIDEPVLLLINKNAEPFAGLPVTDASGVVKQTDEHGEVRFPEDDFDEAASYAYVVNADGNSYAFEVKGQTYKRVDFRTLKVNVAQGGEPVEGAAVRINTLNGTPKQTGGDGSAEFLLLRQDGLQHVLTMEMDGLVFQRKLEDYELLVGEVFLHLGDGETAVPTISGKVLHGASGIGNVVLTAQKEGGKPLYAQTKVDGSYRFLLPKDEEGEYTVGVVETGDYDRGVMTERSRFAVAAGSQNVDFAFEDGVTLRGTVTNTKSLPLPNVKLYLEEVTESDGVDAPLHGDAKIRIRSTMTDEEGRYQFTALESKDYKLSYGIANHIYTGGEAITLQEDTVKDVQLTGYSVTTPRNITYDVSVKSPVEFGEKGRVSVRCQNNDAIPYDNLILEVNVPEGVVIEDSMLGQGQAYSVEERKISMAVNLGGKGTLGGKDSAVFGFMYQLEDGYPKDKVVFTAFAREEAARVAPIETFEKADLDWSRTDEKNTVVRGASSPLWKWSELSRLTTTVTDEAKVWDGQNARNFNMYADGSNITKDYATWKFQTNLGNEYRRFRSEFAKPDKDYRFSHILSQNYAAYSGSGAVFPINDEVFLFVYPKGTAINDGTAGQYLAFWGSTQYDKYGKDGKFMGVAGNKAIWYKSTGIIPALQHTDYWVLDGTKNRVGEIMDAHPEADEFVIDVFASDFNQGGGMDRFDLVFTDSEIPSLEGTNFMPYVDFVGMGHADLFQPMLTGDECVTLDFAKNSLYEMNGQSMKGSDVTIYSLDTGDAAVAPFFTEGVYSGKGTLLPPVPGNYAFIAECRKGGAVQYSNIHVVEVLEDLGESPLKLTSATLEGKTEYGDRPFVSAYTMYGWHSKNVASVATTFNEELRQDDEVYYRMAGVAESFLANGDLKAVLPLIDLKTKYVSVVVMRDGREIFNQIIGRIYIGVDPSGYVYDAHTGRRIEGAVTTCYVLNGQGEWEVWNAEDCGQVNPLMTNEEGRYAWDVPDGVYKVTVGKEGYRDYDTLYDERYAFDVGKESSIVIPPPRLDIDMGIVNIQQPRITGGFVEDGGTVSPQDAVYFRFNKAMDAESLAEEVVLEMDGNPVEVEVGFNSVQDVLTLTPRAALQEGDYTVRFGGGAWDYVKEQKMDATTHAFTVSEEAPTTHEALRFESPDVDVDSGSEIVVAFNQEVRLSEKPDLIEGLDEGDNPYASLTSVENGEAIAVSLAVGEDGASVRVRPFAELATSSEYVLTLSHIESVEGLPLQSKQLTVRTTAKATVPTANVNSGDVPQGTLITLSTATDGATIRYTADGTEPNGNSAIYDAPIMIMESAIIKAATFKAGMSQSGTEVFIYTIGAAGEVTTSPPPEGTTSPPPKGTTSPPPKGTTSPPPKGTTSPPPKGTTSPPPKGTTSPPPEGTTSPPPEGTVSPPPKETTSPPPKGTASPPPKGTASPPPKGTASPPPKGTTSPPPAGIKSPSPSLAPLASPSIPDNPSTAIEPKTVWKLGRPTSLKVRKKKAKLVATWKKVGKASGYQIMVAENKKFTKAKKSQTIVKDTVAKPTRFAFKGLRRGKAYYVRVRAYGFEGQRKRYGKWTKAVKVKLR